MIYGNEAIVNSRQEVCLTIGNFDGVHRGHLSLLEQAKKGADGLPVVVLTFDPPPWAFFHQDNQIRLLLPLQTKIKYLLESDVDAVYVQTFDKDFAELTADEFCYSFLATKFNIEKLFIGYDFHYGKGREGNLVHLQRVAQKMGWEVTSGVALVDSTQEAVSSSRIRSALEMGQIDIARNLLGRDYELEGVVVKGKQLGRQIGFPTANLGQVQQLLPAPGVFAVEVFVGDSQVPYQGVMNCGNRPTVGDGLLRQAEAHIFHFDENIYGEKIRFVLKKFIRQEIKFPNFESLKEQIQKDVADAKLYFGIG